MRVSTSQVYTLASQGISQGQAGLNKIQEQINTGKKVLSPADDPVAATAILQLTQELARTEQYKKNIDLAENSLDLEESTLKSVTGLIQRMREIAVASGNTAVLTAEDYGAYAAEVETRISELLSLQNTRNATGQYIFAGYQSGSQPFVVSGAGNYAYQGDEGQLYLQASSSVQVAVSDSGKKVFGDIPSGHNTFTTYASSTNKAIPPASISVGDVVDQEAFDKLYPEDLVVSFSQVGGATVYSVAERASGKQLLANQPYVQGQDIKVAGARFFITGTPDTGIPAQATGLDFGSLAATDFSATPASITLTVGSRTEVLQLNTAINSPADLAAALSSTAGSPSNQDKLAALGVSVTAAGLTVANGLPLRLSAGTVATDAVFGIATQGSGSLANNGVPAKNGDSFVVESSDKQSLLNTLSRFAQALRSVQNTPQSKADMANLAAKTLTNLTHTETRITSVQGELGARLNTLDSARSMNLDITLTTKTVLSSLRDINVADASIELSMQSLVLNAAQQSFVKISQMSLFNFL